MTVPNIFANATTSIPLSQLDQNFATPITLGNATVTLGGTLTSVGNLTLTNVTLTSLSAALVAAYGGTGLTSPGSGGNVLTSDGAGGWASIAPVLPGGFAWQSVKTSAFAGVTKCGYPVNTTGGAITATLPASPTAGDYMTFVDYARTFATNALTIDPNGGKINGVAGTTVLNTNGAAVSIVYVDATQGWIAYSGFTAWPIGGYTVNYLVVAGAGGGSLGGGGAGGYQASSSAVVSGNAYTVTVGAGGAANTVGSNSSISGVVTAYGGGLGGKYDATATLQPGGPGGSGGGGGGNPNAASASPGGAAYPSQGYAGGYGYTDGGATAHGGGGGGSGSAGTNATLGAHGTGGSGTSNSISGSAVTYAAGGSPSGGAGSANTGNGGGTSAAGGSGIVVISYPGAQRGTGGTVTTAGGYTIHTFTSSGTFNA